MRYDVGDEVYIKRNLSLNNALGGWLVGTSVGNNVGNKVKITSKEDGGYYNFNSSYNSDYLTDEMVDIPISDELNKKETDKMSNFKFKVGDKVRVSDHDHIREGTVETIDENDSDLTYYIGQPGRGLSWWVGEEQLSLLKEDKLVMPKWFDDWYSELSNDSKALYFVARTGFGFGLSDNNRGAFKFNGEHNSYSSAFVALGEGDSQEGRKKMIRAILDGYTVEEEPKEKLYKVKVENHEEGYLNEVRGKYSLDTGRDSTTPLILKDGEPKHYKTEFTEKEIKDMPLGMFLWSKRVPVQEEC